MATFGHKAARPADGERAFEVGLLPRIAAIPFFRPATDDEIDRSYEAYRAGDFEKLCDVWCEVAQPTRADLGPTLTRFYDRARWAPSRANGLAFLATVRAVLRAGEKFRRKLSARTQEALTKEFPWLERRHERESRVSGIAEAQRTKERRNDRSLGHELAGPGRPEHLEGAR